MRFLRDVNRGEKNAEQHDHNEDLQLFDRHLDANDVTRTFSDYSNIAVSGGAVDLNQSAPWRRLVYGLPDWRFPTRCSQREKVAQAGGSPLAYDPGVGLVAGRSVIAGAEEGRTMRISTLYLSALLVFFGGSETIFAQNAENGQRLSQRRCLPCHAVSPVQGKVDKPRSLESIANTENVNFDKIVSFLLLPHARMPNFPLSRKDAGDIAAYISQMKK